MSTTNQNDISLVPSESKHIVDVDIEERDIVYRVWDNVGKKYIKSPQKVRIFLRRIWAQRLCDNANKFAPGRYELRVFALTEVDEDVLGLFALNK